jgi:hypothetical protein
MMSKNSKNTLVLNKQLPSGMIFYPLVSVAEIVGHYFGITTEEIIYGINRQIVFSKARHIVRWILMTHTVIRAKEYDFFEDYHRFEHSQIIRSTREVNNYISVKSDYIYNDVNSIMVLVEARRQVDKTFDLIFKNNA